MKRRTVPLMMVLVLALVLVLSLAGLASAAVPANDGAGRDFGQHHAEHAQLHGLNGEMNPGMHRGMSGWGL